MALKRYGRLHMDKEEMREHLLKFIEDLETEGLSKEEIDSRIGAYYTNNIIKRYSREEQDKMWDQLMYIMFEVEGGYWHIVNNMNYWPEFEHYNFRCLRSEFGSK